MADSEEGGEEADTREGHDPDPLDRTAERTFTCTLCGYATVREVDLLQWEFSGVCLNCGDWTVQTAAVEDVVEAGREAATELAGPTLTERQALAYLLREVVGVDRQVAAEAMDSTPSNVDNLQRRAAEKVDDAERIVDGLDVLRGGDSSPDGDERRDESRRTGDDASENGNGEADGVD